MVLPSLVQSCRQHRHNLNCPRHPRSEHLPNAGSAHPPNRLRPEATLLDCHLPGRRRYRDRALSAALDVQQDRHAPSIGAGGPAHARDIDL